MEDILWSTLMCNYSATGALVFTCWDLLITSGDMIETVWTQPWTATSTLCVLMRVFSLTAQIVASVLTLDATAKRSTVVAASDCARLVIFQGIASQLLTMCMQIVLILRVVALYHDRPYLRYVLGGLWLGESVAMSVILKLENIGIRFNSQCVVTHFPRSIPVFFVLPIAMDGLLFTLTMIKFYQSLRDVYTRVPWIQQFMQDGVWAFALPLASAIVNLFCMSYLSSAMSSVAFTWQIAIPGFAGYRLILHLRRLAPIVVSRNEDGVDLDTIAMTVTTLGNNCSGSDSTGTESSVYSALQGLPWHHPFRTDPCR